MEKTKISGKEYSTLSQLVSGQEGLVTYSLKQEPNAIVEGLIDAGGTIGILQRRIEPPVFDHDEITDESFETTIFYADSQAELVLEARKKVMEKQVKSLPRESRLSNDPADDALQRRFDERMYQGMEATEIRAPLWENAPDA